LDWGAFTTFVSKLFGEKLEETGSEVVELPLEKPVKMKTAVKNVLTIAISMVHVIVQLTTRAGPGRIRSLRALMAQGEIEDMLIGISARVLEYMRTKY
jgi:hypothetical protein